MFSIFQKKMQYFRVEYLFDGKVYIQIGTSAGIASLDTDPYVEILSVTAL